MGYYKQKQIEDEERGVDSSATGYILCQNCFGNPGLKKFIFENSIDNSDPDDLTECDFCDASVASLVVADMDAVCEHIVACIKHRYNNPAEELPYETREGGYQGTVHYTSDLLEELELPNDKPGALQEALERAITGDYWCKRDYFGLSDSEEYHFSWDQFKEVAKEGTVLQFMYGTIPGDRETMSPVEFLDWLGEQCIEFGLIKTIRAGTTVFRVREQLAGPRFTTAYELGPPPIGSAKENRLSPAGTVMMYVAEALNTAIAETITRPAEVAVGEFTFSRDIRVLDLVDLPAPICFFDLSDADAREVMGFLRQFATDVSAPLANSNEPHLEYRPTQILTQHVRRRLRDSDSPLDGIRYRSAQQKQGVCLGLFADSLNVVDSNRGGKRPLRLDGWVVLSDSYGVEVE